MPTETPTTSALLRRIADAIEGAPGVLSATVSFSEPSVHLVLADFRERFAGQAVARRDVGVDSYYSITADGIQWKACESHPQTEATTVTL